MPAERAGPAVQEAAGGGAVEGGILGRIVISFFFLNVYLFASVVGVSCF